MAESLLNLAILVSCFSACSLVRVVRSSLAECQLVAYVLSPMPGTAIFDPDFV
jgi:hypothetical protein